MACEVENAQGVFEAGVPRAGIYKEDMPQLRNITKSLKLFGVYQRRGTSL